MKEPTDIFKTINPPQSRIPKSSDHNEGNASSKDDFKMLGNPSGSTVTKLQNKASKPAKPQTESQGNQMGLHGAMYQLKLFMLFLYRGISREYSFRLGTEIKEAKKFDDLVFEYDKDQRKEYRFVQAKHRFDESKKITIDHLLTESDGDFSLTKYYFSFRDSKKEKLFKNGTIKDVTICTNIDFDFENLRCENIEVIDIVDVDDILDVKININCFKTKQPKRYRFSKSIIPLLRPKLQNYNLTRLARRLVECFLENKSIKHHDVNDIFTLYHLALAEEVIDVKKKNFRETFIQNDPSLSENAQKFRKSFIEELNRKASNNLKIEDINKALNSKRKIVQNKEVGLNLSKNFEKGDQQIWPDNSIPEEDVVDFLNHLVFAVGQPNEEELDKVINDEIGKAFVFDYITTENIYNKFFVTNLKWLLSKERGRFLSYTEGREFLENAKNRIPICFDVRDPIDSFIGRERKLEELHNLLQTRYIAVISQTDSIKGCGGVGKSELARKYIYEYSEDYNNKIIWINAESYYRLQESFRRLAQYKLRIPSKNIYGQEKHIKSIIDEVYDFFSKGKCLFIFDNVEQQRTQGNIVYTIDEFLPTLSLTKNRPYILITSRHRDWCSIEPIILDVLTEKEAMQCMLKALSIEEDDSRSNEIQELVKTLHYFPLALQQAIAYFKKRNVTSTTSVETDCIQSYYEDIRKILDFKTKSETDNLYTIITYSTWKMTADKIKNNPECGYEAAEILNIMAYFDADNVNANIFLDLVNNNPEKLESAIQLLRHYSMIDLGSEEGELKIHRLVQEVIKIYLKDQHKENEVVEKAYNLFKLNKDQQALTHRDKFVCHVTELGKNLPPAIEALALLTNDFNRKHVAPTVERAFTQAGEFTYQYIRPTVEAVDEFAKQYVVPTVGTVMKHTDEFARQHVAPTVETVIKQTDEFARQHVAPTVETVIKQTDEFARQHVAPTVETVIKHTDEFARQHVAPTVETAIKQTDEFAREHVAPAVKTVITQTEECIQSSKEHLESVFNDIGRDISRFFK